MHASFVHETKLRLPMRVVSAGSGSGPFHFDSKYDRNEQATEEEAEADEQKEES